MLSTREKWGNAFYERVRENMLSTTEKGREHVFCKRERERERERERGSERERENARERARSGERAQSRHTNR